MWCIVKDTKLGRLAFKLNGEQSDRSSGIPFGSDENMINSTNINYERDFLGDFLKGINETNQLMNEASPTKTKIGS